MEPTRTLLSTPLFYGNDVPNESVILLKPYLDCTITQTGATHTDYVYRYMTSWSNSTSGSWTIYVFPTVTYTETQYVYNSSTTVTVLR